MLARSIMALRLQSSKAVALSLSLCSLWLAACSAQKAAKEPIAQPSSETETGPETSANQTVSDTSELSSEPPPDAPPSRFLLQLASDAGFLDRSLGAVHEGRYRTFREKKQIQVGHGYLYSAEVLADGTSLLVASGEERSVRIYERESGRLRLTVPIAFAADFEASALGWPELDSKGAPAFLTASSRGIALISARDGSELALLDGEPADSLRFSPDQRILISRTSRVPQQTSVLRFYERDRSELRLVGSLSFEERVDGAALSRDNRLLALSHYPADDLRVIDLASGTDVLRVPAPRYAGSVDFSPDGRFVAIGGEGLLVVDLLNPDRRAYYDALHNNINTVQFSPSGDALVISAYDGRLRILSLRSELPGEGESSRLSLRLEKELRHSGSANVYGFSFDADGSGLVSASGDRTVRWFRGAAPGSDSESPRHFRSLAAWRELAPPDASRSSPPAPPRFHDGILIVPAAEAPPRPTRLAPGSYDCKITKLYRMRDCTVERLPSGHTWLRFEPGNLFSLAGIVYDDGDVIRFEGSLTEPSSVMDCRDCEKQPVLGVLRGKGDHLEGMLVFRTYYDPMVSPELPEKNIVIEEANGRFPIELKRRKNKN